MNYPHSIDSLESPESRIKNDFLRTIRKNVGLITSDPETAAIAGPYPAAENMHNFTEAVERSFAMHGLDAEIGMVGYGSLVGSGGVECLGEVPQGPIVLQGWERRLDVLAQSWRNQQLAEGMDFGTVHNHPERGVASAHYTGNTQSSMTAVIMPTSLRDMADMLAKLDLREGSYVLVPIGMEDARMDLRVTSVPAVLLHPVSEKVTLQRFAQKDIEQICLQDMHLIKNLIANDSITPNMSYTLQCFRGAAEGGNEDGFLDTTIAQGDMTLRRYLNRLAPGNNSKVRPWHGKSNESIDPLSGLRHFSTSPVSKSQNRERIEKLMSL